MLEEKHKHHLNEVQRDINLSQCKQQCFTPAVQDSKHKGVCLQDGLLMPTYHHFFVDDDIYCDIFNWNQMQQAMAANIEASTSSLGSWTFQLDRTQCPSTSWRTCSSATP